MLSLNNNHTDRFAYDFRRAFRTFFKKVELAKKKFLESMMIITRFVGAVAFGLVIGGATTLPAFAAPPAANGEALFRQRCQVCHSVVTAKSAGVGPNLRGVVGRKAAAAAFNYSNAMQQSKITWTQANLDRYLTAPIKMVPGTRMVIAVTDAAQRAALIKYLSQTK
jgi:cytochrome c